MLEYVHSRTVELEKGLEHKCDEKWLKELGVFSMEEGQGGLIFVYNHLKGGCYQVGVGLISQVTSGMTKGNHLRLHQRRFGLNIGKKFLHQNCCQALAQAAQESGGVIVPGDI